MWKEKQEEERRKQEEQIKAFTKEFMAILFELGEKENLPESLKFKGINCIRKFDSGDSVSFNIIFNKAK